MTEITRPIVLIFEVYIFLHSFNALKIPPSPPDPNPIVHTYIMKTGLKFVKNNSRYFEVFGDASAASPSIVGDCI